MTTEAAKHSVIVEREFPHPPEKVWRALSERALIEQWLAQNDFDAAAGHAFTLRMDPVQGWDGRIECKVLVVEALRELAYMWTTMGMETVVTFTLTPTDAGTHMRVEQTGFRADQPANLKGAQYGWQRFLGGLERVVATLD